MPEEYALNVTHARKLVLNGSLWIAISAIAFFVLLQWKFTNEGRIDSFVFGKVNYKGVPDWPGGVPVFVLLFVCLVGAYYVKCWLSTFISYLFEHSFRSHFQLVLWSVVSLFAPMGFLIIVYLANAFFELNFWVFLGILALSLAISMVALVLQIIFSPRENENWILPVLDRAFACISGWGMLMYAAKESMTLA